jgi:hypothetical protein
MIRAEATKFFNSNDCPKVKKTENVEVSSSDVKLEENA